MRIRYTTNRFVLLINLIFMSNSFLPTKDALLLLWVANYRKNIQEFSAELGLTDSELKEELAICETLINNLNFVNGRKLQLRVAIKNCKNAIRTEGAKLCAKIEAQKSHPAYTREMDRALGILSAE